MRTLLIVDDEPNIRFGLKAMIEREQPGRYDFCFASDGEEALVHMRSRTIDLVITDIRMPGMDGLALIREIRSCSSAPEVLILSGYDDFQYAKEAIRYGVKEYLLKPIVREELFKALERAGNELDRQREVAGRLNALDRARDELLAAQLNYIWLHPDIGEEEVERRCADIGLSAFEPLYYVGILRCPAGERCLAAARRCLAAAVKESGDGAAASARTRAVAAEDKDGQLVFVTNDAALPDVLMAHLAAERHDRSCIGFSAGLRRIGELKRGFQQASRALKYRLLLSGAAGRVIRYDSVKEQGRDYIVPVEAIRKLANMLGTDRDSEMKALLAELLDANRLARYDIALTERISAALNEHVFDQAFNRYGEESVEIIRMYKQAGDLCRFETIRDYHRCVEDLLLRLNDYIRGLRSVFGEHQELRRAVEYIHDHYDRDLNMATVSNHVSLSYTYFSQAFKEYTGESFVVYLKKVRIGKAKELLVRTDDKIYEIAAKVGFDSVKQFNRVFRELEGVSAQEYRTVRRELRESRQHSPFPRV
ncbi:two-component system response regulator [Paenibacillus sp. 32O-W]|uniref:response regulator n=1 Tax=Paenibacillus sp. 32O-W TaxID=1695218 RepID=UPI0007204D28|nr:response regulator [Paenibacillus sp. 32O-W]ALS26479.1 two-component system response regulator [Paenibacillus sp. 32O-W]